MLTRTRACIHSRTHAYKRIKVKDITPSMAWRREEWKEEALDDIPSKDERGP